MSTKPPLISVGMPVYNGARTLRHALDSILAQSFTDFEIVISDNASTDETASIVAEYSKLDPRIRLHRNSENVGARANYNRVLDLARGDLFKWAAHDDWISTDYLERCVDAMRADPTVVLCYSAACRVDARRDTLRIVTPARPLARSSSAALRMHDVLWRLPYFPIFGVFRTSVLRAAQGIPNCPEPDRVTLARAALQGPFMQISDVLFFQRSPEKNTPNRNVWTWLDPSNVSRRRIRAVRVGRELCSATNRSDLPFSQRWWLFGDICIALAIKSVRGKARQIRRRYGIRYGHGPKLAETYVADWERQLAKEARIAIGRSGRREEASSGREGDPA